MTTRQGKQSTFHLFPEKAGYIQLLLDTPDINANSKWNDSEHLIVTDPRYQAVDKALHRIQWFNKYVEQLKKVDYIKLLQDTPEISKQSKFHEVRHLIDTDPRYRAVDTDIKTAELFRQYVEQLTDNSKEDINVFLTFDLLISIEGPHTFLSNKPMSMGNQIKLQSEMKEFANWTKCVLAQTKTREALAIVATKLFNMLVKRAIGRNELLVFLICLEKQNVLHLKVKRRKKTNADNKSTWNCEHASCAYLLKTLLEHHIPKQTDEWDVHPSTKTKQDKNENKGSTLKNKASTSPEEEAKQDDELILSEDQLWLIVRLYMFTGSQNEGKHCQNLQKLDISQIIKLQSCCNLFEFDGSVEIYHKIIENRNNLMHSEDNLVSSENLKQIFGYFYILLEAFEKESVCAGVIEELKEFEKSSLKINVHDMVHTFQEEAIQALETKEKALQNDIYNPEDESNPEKKSSSDLERLLKKTQEEKRNFARKMKEMKLEIEKLTELISATNKSDKSRETVFRYVYLTKSPYPIIHMNIEMEEGVKRLLLEKIELEKQLKQKNQEIQASNQQREKRILQLNTEKELKRRAAGDVMQKEENMMREIQMRMTYIDKEIASLE